MRERYEDCGLCRCCVMRGSCEQKKCDLIKIALGEIKIRWQASKRSLLSKKILISLSLEK